MKKQGSKESKSRASSEEKKLQLLGLDFSDFFFFFEDLEVQEKIQILDDDRFTDTAFECLKIIIKQRLDALQLAAPKMRATRIYELFNLRYDTFLRNVREAVNSKKYVARLLLEMLNEMEEEFLFPTTAVRYRK